MNETVTEADVVELVPGTPEYDEAMAERFDESQITDDTVQTSDVQAGEDRPDWLPEKFKTPEDLARAYAELEKKQSSGQSQQQPTGSAEEQAREAAESAGFDYDALSAKFAQNGDLDAEDYAALEARGITRDMVIAYVQGQAALAAQYRATVTETVGGDEQYTAMIEWAAQNLTQSEILAFDNVIDTGDVDQIRLAVAGLHARYTAANGSEPRLVAGDTVVPAGDVFRSTAELTAAMRDPRYKTDPAYRADVQAKLGRSTIF